MITTGQRPSICSERSVLVTDSYKKTEALQRLTEAARNDENVFAELMNAVQYCSLGESTDTFFEVGGQYRRNM